MDTEVLAKICLGVFEKPGNGVPPGTPFPIQN